MGVFYGIVLYAWETLMYSFNCSNFGFCSSSFGLSSHFLGFQTDLTCASIHESFLSRYISCGTMYQCHVPPCVHVSQYGVVELSLSTVDVGLLIGWYIHKYELHLFLWGLLIGWYIYKYELHLLLQTSCISSLISLNHHY